MAIFSFLHLWLASGQMLTGLGRAAHDDQLFMSLAQHLVNGQWLGPFNNLTLAKEPLYPIWIAATYALGVPLKIGHHLLYVAACAVTILAVRPVVRSAAALAAVYAVLVLDPMMFGINRVVREGLYVPLTVLLAGCLIGLYVRRASSLRSLAAWAGGAGLALTAMWLTRAETIWVLPAVVLVAAAAAFLEWRRGAQRLWRRCVLFVSPLASLGVVLALVSAINLYVYGVFVVTEVAATDWLAAYGALARVQHDVPQRYVVVPRHVRERIYAVSPAFAELRSSMEGDLLRGWMSHGCQMMPDTCGDITAGWFMWLLRDAVAYAGYYRSAPAALGYYRRLAREVNAACDAGTLRCGPPRTTMMPPWRSEYGPLVVRSLKAAVTQVVRFEGISVHTMLSDGDEVALLPFRLMTRERLAPSTQVARLRAIGWGFSPDNDLLLTVRDATGAPAEVTLSPLPGRDVFDYFVSTEGRRFERARDSRFTLWTPCLRGCTLVVMARGQDRVLGTLPLAEGAKSITTPDLRMHLDIAKADPGVLARYPLDAFKLTILTELVRLYGWIGPILAVVAGLVVLGAPIALARGAAVALLVPLVMLVVAFLGRVGLIAIIDATSFPSRTAHYLGSAYPLLLMAGLVACLEGGRGIMPRKKAAAPEKNALLSRRTTWLTAGAAVVVLALLAAGYMWFSRSPAAVARKVQSCCKDIDGDGKADILWRQASGGLALWTVSGTSVLKTGALSAEVRADWTIVGLGDFNGDGTADILWRQSSGTVSVWLLKGTEVIGSGVLPSAPADWTIAGIGDFNGDGKADILWRQSSGAVAVWLLDGTKIAGTRVLGTTAPPSWNVAGVQDFNGDGKADILWVQSSGVSAIWLVDGANVIGTGTLPAPGSDWTVAGVGDFNGDGKADILWRQSSGLVAVWLLSGTSLLGSGLVAGSAHVDAEIVGVGDFNGDRKADILWRQASGNVAVWLLDGTNVLGTGGLPARAPKEWVVQ